MPIYEYRCQDCRSIFEEMRSISQADAPITCSQCGGTQSKRIISLVVSHSKGGKSVSGGSTSCTSCSSHTCSTCGTH
ncbi:MAG: zinc ribbon domain-containing protein [candidate division Zixibacteria bacterium]|nr:zinc ribbon domain-containing protein [Phycisphaerae bacterium]NIP42481.1 zinc ribbon domain-containing protein [candidate division Zixibacteria bacterium]NIW45294.1 zinc ribbon domain-containing protein [Gammaproteobacteria bacterium]NIR64431.1 zinc ribbon domain-containing protein [candidate division Zixibacteria bacterium]NIS46339.1 zinc ribbon domain-containing protein [candidate division Zixibacteria bacterium]